ncbi:MAG: hypothetical protein Q7S07_04775 [Candidatus Omnitrophota bacterium]|nr:hypothetical protein [Candidatus Omnitrophota bacterium]
MRYLYIIAAVIFVFGATVIFTGNSAAMCGSCGTDTNDSVKKPQVKQSQGKEIVTDLNEEKKSDDKEFGVNNEREMPQSDTYDENTGLPNVVESDKAGEIE